MAPQAPRAVRAQNLYLETQQKIDETPRAGGAPISISPVLSNLQRRYILGRIQSDLRSPSSISNLQRRHLRPDSVRSPISISNLQSPISIRGPGGGGGLKPSRRCAMDSFTMQKDLHPLFAPFCNLQSAHTISRRLWREVRISTSVARSQATARTKREISDSSRASTPEKICLHQFFNDQSTAALGRRFAT